MRYRLYSALASVLGIALLASNDAAAEDQSYYSGNQWEVVLSNTYAVTGTLPFCRLRTTMWTQKYVSFEITLRGVDDLVTVVRLHKDGWNLPTGQTTNVGLGSAGYWAQIAMKAINEDELYIALENLSEGRITLGGIMNIVLKDLKPSGLAIAFEGDEQPWFGTAVTFYDGSLITEALSNCNADLQRLGPSLFGAATTPSSTSPFKKNNAEPALQKDVPSTR